MNISVVLYELMDDSSISSISQQSKIRKFTNVLEDNEYENGYDSDGKIGPFYEAVMNEDAMYASYIEYANKFTSEA